MTSLSSVEPTSFDFTTISSQMCFLEKGVLEELIVSGNIEMETLLKSGSSENINELILNLVLQQSADIAFKDWKGIFAGMSAQDAKRMAKLGREQLAIESRSLTYGEVEFFSFASILELLNPKPGSIFVDLGHGTGRAIIAAAMLRGDRFKQLIGIELLEPLADASNVALKRYNNLVELKPTLYCKSDNILLYQGDFLSKNLETTEMKNNNNLNLVSNQSKQNEKTAQEEDEPNVDLTVCWLGADFIFANSTCFSQELMTAIGDKVENLKSGTVIVTLTSSLEKSPYLELTATRMFAMSWGASTAFIHVRI